MPGTSLTCDRSAQLDRGSLAVRSFQLAVVQASSKHEADDYRGDKIVFKSICQVPAKRLPVTSLAENYFHHYLAYLESSGDLQVRDRFMQAKLEKTRFPQFAGPWHSTITQVTATTPLLLDLDNIFSTALCNIFSATFKPIDTASFLRGIRTRFKITRYEAFSRGEGGMFRKDIPESLEIRPVDSTDEAHKQGQCVFGHIILICVHHRAHHTSHTVFSVARGPFKAPLEAVPTFLPSRVCISWVPGVKLEQVEEWWRALLERPCLQQPLEQHDAESLHVRFTEAQFQVQKPMTEGMRVIQAALKAEFSDLVVDLCHPVEAVALSAEMLDVTDEDLLNSPVPSVRSSEPDFESDD
eukprot:jgi/Ulvmu1/374/UM001_0381.1